MGLEPRTFCMTTSSGGTQVRRKPHGCPKSLGLDQGVSASIALFRDKPREKVRRWAS